jgi:hypothetical protein
MFFFRNPTAFFCALFFCLGTGVAAAQGSAFADGTSENAFNYKPLNPRAFVQLPKQVLSQAERAGVCQSGRRDISFRCQVDSTGRILAVTAMNPDGTAGKLPAPVLAKLEEGIRRNMAFYPLTAAQARFARARGRNRHRDIVLGYGLNSFCE